MSGTELAIGLIAGLAAGGGAAWLLARARQATLTERLAGKQGELDQLAARAQESAAELVRLRAENSGLAAELAAAKTALEKEQEAAVKLLAQLDKAHEQLSNEFKALSADALSRNSDEFLKIARATLDKHQEAAKGELEKRQQAIGELVKPVGDSLVRMDAVIRALESKREGAYGTLQESVRGLLETQGRLQKSTDNLVNALGAPRVRGRWGEIQLKRVVELAGMLNHCDFFEQLSSTTADGRLRPDLVVRLPGGKNIVVDSKAPLEGYLRALEAGDDATRQAGLADHARQIRDHLKKLGAKSYWEHLQPTPEFVVLFLPGEQFFGAALEKDPALIEDGVSERVILATPTTLIALLKAVSYGWRQEDLAKNAQEISAAGRELHKRVAVLVEHIADIGRNLDQSVKAYNKAVASIESRVLPGARRFESLHAAAEGEKIAELPPVETTPRDLPAPEDIAPPADQPD